MACCIGEHGGILFIFLQHVNIGLCLPTPDTATPAIGGVSVKCKPIWAGHPAGSLSHFNTHCFIDDMFVKKLESRNSFLCSTSCSGHIGLTTCYNISLLTRLMLAALHLST